MTTSNTVTYTSTKSAWYFWFDTGWWLGIGLTMGAACAGSGLLLITTLILKLFGVR